MEERQDLYWSALVDSAFDYPNKGVVPYTLGGVNCYKFDEFEGLEAAAPWLMPISASGHAQEKLRELLMHCRGRPMLSFVASRQPATALRDDWKHLHWITAVDEQRMLLRMADTRILPVLPRVLSAEQWIAFGSSIEYWSCINREGCLEVCSSFSDAFVADARIHLSQTQLDELLLAVEPDAIIDLLNETMSDIVPVELKNQNFMRL